MALRERDECRPRVLGRRPRRGNERRHELRSWQRSGSQGQVGILLELAQHGEEAVVEQERPEVVPDHGEAASDQVLVELEEPEVDQPAHVAEGHDGGDALERHRQRVAVEDVAGQGARLRDNQHESDVGGSYGCHVVEDLDAHA